LASSFATRSRATASKRWVGGWFYSIYYTWWYIIIFIFASFLSFLYFSFPIHIIPII
jgi:hypothetical protein